MPGFRLPVDAKKLQDTFKDLSGILPHDEDAKKKWIAWGVSENMVRFLGKISGAIGIIATAIAVYAWAIKVLIDLMGLMQEEMSPELGKALADIKNQLQGQGGLP